MIGKLTVKLATRFALKKHRARRGGPDYHQAKRIGIVYSHGQSGQPRRVMDLVKKLVRDGKSVDLLAYIPKKLKKDDYEWPSFSEGDLTSKGRWKNDQVLDFRSNDFDYLISTDLKINKFIRNILASSNAKCRVGRYFQGDEAYFELMINHSDQGTHDFHHEIYHYLTQIKHG